MRGGEEYWKLKWLARQVNKNACLDIFANTRRRNYTEARSVFNQIARKVFLYSYDSIAKFYKINGKASDHSTIIHSVKVFEDHIRFSPIMQRIYDSIDPSTVSNSAKKFNAITMVENLTDDNAAVAYEYIKAIYDEQRRMEQMGQQVVQADMVHND